MKKLFFLFGTALIPLLAGCASSPTVSTAPVGPNPDATQNANSSTGALEVFSKVVRHHDNQEAGGDGMPGWNQHVHYIVCDANGKAVKHVEQNAAGHFSEAPEHVALPPGNYVVKAEAEDYFSVSVPVIIESGRTTRVHLDDKWQPPANTPRNELVMTPDGRAVGWVTTEAH